MQSREGILKVDEAVHTPAEMSEMLRSIMANMALREETVSKEELAEQLKAYATKEDLKNELKAYATKDEIRAMFGEFVHELKDHTTKVVARAGSIL